MYGTASTSLPESFGWYTAGLGRFWPHCAREEFAFVSWKQELRLLLLPLLCQLFIPEIYSSLVRPSVFCDTVGRTQNSILFLLCQENTYFADRPQETKEPKKDTVHLAWCAEMLITLSLPGSSHVPRAVTDSFPPLLALRFQFSFLMLFWILKHISQNTCWLLKFRSGLGHSDISLIRKVLSQQRSCSWMVQTSLRICSLLQDSDNSSFSKNTGILAPPNKSPFSCVFYLKFAYLNRSSLSLIF